MMRAFFRALSVRYGTDFRLSWRPRAMIFHGTAATRAWARLLVRREARPIWCRP